MKRASGGRWSTWSGRATWSGAWRARARRTGLAGNCRPPPGSLARMGQWLRRARRDAESSLSGSEASCGSSITNGVASQWPVGAVDVDGSDGEGGRLANACWDFTCRSLLGAELAGARAPAQAWLEPAVCCPPSQHPSPCPPWAGGPPSRPSSAAGLSGRPRTAVLQHRQSLSRHALGHALQQEALW